jgi:SAM-dependent methyltransferase
MMILDFGGIGHRKEEGITTVNIEQPCDIVHDLDKLPYPFEDCFADGIRMRHTLEHLREPKDVIMECCRILKPGGILDVAVPYGPTAAKNPSHRYDFYPEWFKEFGKPGSPLNARTIGGSFRVKVWTIYGKIRFWKPYEIRVQMVKKRRPE